MDKEEDTEIDSFEKVYNRIVVENRILNEKEKKHNHNIFELSKIVDYNLILYYEYFLKLSYFSSNVNILNIYKVVESKYEKELEEVAMCLKSNLLLSVVDLHKLEVGENIIDYFLKNYENLKNFEYVVGNTDYPIGFEKNTNGVYRVFLFKLIPSKTLLLHKNNLHLMDSGTIPANYDSIAVDKQLYKEHRQNIENRKKDLLIESTTNSKGNYSYLYKCKSSKQIMPLFLIEFEFKCLRVDVSIPLCDYCHVTSALFYCYNDKAHLCDVCDMKYHEKNKILRNHRRIHISESPYQFGRCPFHPDELVENVCATCCCTLCSNCLLIGSHSNNHFRNHPVTGIREAFILSNQNKSVSEVQLENRKLRILNLLKKKHKLLSEIYSNYASLQKRIDHLYKHIITELKMIKKKKLDFLMALKRCILSELLIIEWMEAFFFHTKLALNFSDFIRYQQKHESLIQFLCYRSKEMNLVKYTPEWIFQKIFIHSDLFIYEDQFFKVHLTGNKKLEMIIKNKKEEGIEQLKDHKLESIYNFNDIFSAKNRNVNVLDDARLHFSQNEKNKDEEEHVKYAAKLKQNSSEDTRLFEIKDSNYLSIEKKIEDTLDLTNGTTIGSEKIHNELENFHILYYIFKEKQKKEKDLLTNTYVYNELWNNLSNFKYINVIHICKVQVHHDTLELMAAFLNIANYYEKLEDFVRHIVKHETYTLFNSNIQNTTKMKVTKLLDHTASLLCIQKLTFAHIIDRHLQHCFEELQNKESELMEQAQQLLNTQQGQPLFQNFKELKRIYQMNQIIQDNEKEEQYEEEEEREKEEELIKEHRRNASARQTVDGIPPFVIKNSHSKYSEIANTPKILVGVKRVASLKSADGMKRMVSMKTIEGLKRIPSMKIVGVKRVPNVKIIDGVKRVPSMKIIEGIKRIPSMKIIDGVKRVPSMKIMEGMKRMQSFRNMPSIGGSTTQWPSSFKGKPELTILEEIGAAKEHIHREPLEKGGLPNVMNNFEIDEPILTDKEKSDLGLLKKLKEYIIVYVQKLINEITQFSNKDLNESIRFLFYLIHDEIDGNHTYSMNKKLFSIHTLALCLDLFINSILYPYIFYVHEQNTDKRLMENSLYKKMLIIFSQTLREISIYIFQIYNLGMYDENITTFINNIKINPRMRSHFSNANMFFLDVSQKFFKWIIKILESPRYHSTMKWSFYMNVQDSFEKVVREIVNIDKASKEHCYNENVDYNILFKTKNFHDILTLAYSQLKEI